MRGHDNDKKGNGQNNNTKRYDGEVINTSNKYNITREDNGNIDLYDKSVYKQNNRFENEYEDFRAFQMFEASGSVKDYLLYRDLLRRGTDDEGEDMFIDEDESWSDNLLDDDDSDEF